MKEPDHLQDQQPGEDKQVRFILNIPNSLTLIRLAAVAPLAFMIYRWPAYKISTLILFLAIWTTDFLDGYIARRFNMMTEFGKLFDPFVDKIYQVVTAFMLFAIGLVPIWVPLYYFVRESFMLFGSTLLLTKRRVVVVSDLPGKISTFLFVAATMTLFFAGREEGWFRHVIFIPPVLCSFFATIHYTRQQIGSKKSDDQGQNT